MMLLRMINPMKCNNIKEYIRKYIDGFDVFELELENEEMYIELLNFLRD